MADAESVHEAREAAPDRHLAILWTRSQGRVPVDPLPLVLLVQLSEPVKGTGEPERALVGQQGGPKRGPARWAAEPPQSRPATRTPVVYGGHTWLADVLDWRTSTLKGRRETLQEPRFYQGRPP